MFATFRIDNFNSIRSQFIGSNLSVDPLYEGVHA